MKRTLRIAKKKEATKEGKQSAPELKEGKTVNKEAKAEKASTKKKDKKKTTD